MSAGPLPEAAQLRRMIYDKGLATRTDLIALLGTPAGDDPKFLALIAEVACDALLADSGGFLNEDDADWLTAWLGDGRGLSSRAEFEALKAVLAHAVAVPPALRAFAAREVERAILTGSRGPIGGGDGEPGVVTAGDVEALAALGLGSRPERAVAEVMFDIAHATATATNDPAFPEFFARAVGPYALGAALAVSRDRGRVGLDAFLAAGLSAREAAKSADLYVEDRYFQESSETEARLATAAEVDAGEAKWVLAHLARGGALSAAEMRLLAFLRYGAGEPPSLHRAA